MSDLVKREDAMRVVMWFGRSEEQYPSSYIKKRIMEIPAADRPKGEWIDSTEQTWTPSIKCSNCGAMFHEVATDLIEKYGLSVADDWNFCPNCGADMRGADDERSR